MAAAGVDGAFAHTDAASSAVANANATAAAATAAAAAAAAARIVTKEELTATPSSMLFLRDGRAMSEPTLSPAVISKGSVGDVTAAQTPMLTYGHRASDEVSPLRLGGCTEQKQCTPTPSRTKNASVLGVDDGFHSAVEESFESESASPHRVGIGLSSSSSTSVAMGGSFSPSPSRRTRGTSAPCSPATDGGYEADVGEACETHQNDHTVLQTSDPSFRSRLKHGVVAAKKVDNGTGGLGGDKGDAGAGALALAADEVAAKLGARSGAGVRAAGTVGGSPGRRGDRSGGGSGGYGSCGGGGRGHVHFTYGKPGEVDEAAIGERMLPEPQEGNVEYKLRLANPSPERMVELVTQLNWRLNEGNNEAVYEIGVADDGALVGINAEDMKRSLESLKKMAEALGADTRVMHERKGMESGLTVAEVLIRRQVKAESILELRIAVVGNVDSGKSTLVGVLTKGKLDNGRGLARMQVFRHRHEIENGRTSSVSQQIMGFDSTGEVTNYASLRNSSNLEILQRSSKIVTFCDLAGHEKYLKTTVFGLTGRIPDYVMLVVCAKRGVQRMTKEHLGIALALKLPIFVVITKIDAAPDHVRKNTVQRITRILKSPGVRKHPYKVRTMDSVFSCARNMQGGQDSLVPMFFVSNVDGTGLNFVRTFLNLLPMRNHWVGKQDRLAEFNVDEHFNISGVGTVVAGTMYSGQVSTGDELLMGPDPLGEFKKVVVKSIHTKQMPVETGIAGQSVSFALKFPEKRKGPLWGRVGIRKGMVLVHPEVAPRALRDFEAEILILHHPTTIKRNYQPVIHAGNVRQSARIVSMSSNFVRTGDRTLVHFQFLYHPEYLRVGETILFREGRTKGVGRVTKLIFADGSCVELPESERTRPLGIAEGRSSTGGGNGGEGGGAGGGGGAGSSAKSPKRGGGTKGGKRAASSSPRRGQGKVLSSIHQQPVEAC